jgi:hypothetical protein
LGPRFFGRNDLPVRAGSPQIPVKQPGFGEEHLLAMVAALGDVMWASGNDDPSNPWHHG